MYVMEQLVSERTRSHQELAEQLRHTRKDRRMRRATRIEHRAERRLVEAWRRAAQLRGPEY